MNRLCSSYVRKVGQGLHCSRRTKARLLQGVREEMAEAMNLQGSLTEDDLRRRFGTPEELAAELRASVPSEEAARYHTWQRSRRRLAWVICGLVVVCVVGCILYTTGRTVQIVDSVILYH